MSWTNDSLYEAWSEAPETGEWITEIFFSTMEDDDVYGPGNIHVYGENVNISHTAQTGDPLEAARQMIEAHNLNATVAETKFGPVIRGKFLVLGRELLAAN